MNAKMKSVVYIIVVFAIIIGLGIATGKFSTNTTNYITAKQQQALADSDYTVDEVLTYALQNEYFTQAQYNAIVTKYGAQMPFANIAQMKQMHINLLLPLFEKNNIVVPANDAKKDVILPASLEKSYAAGLQQQQFSVELYNKLLQTKLPVDVETVLKTLLANAKKHTTAFENATSGKMNNQNGMMHGGQGHGGMGNGQGGGMNHSANCNCDMGGGNGGGMNHSSNCNGQCQTGQGHSGMGNGQGGGMNHSANCNCGMNH